MIAVSNRLNPFEERLAEEAKHLRLACITRLAVAQVSIEIADGEDYPGTMSDHDIARFRAQADECREQAERAINPLDKEQWLRLAGDWIKMAQEAEKRLGKG